MALLAAAGAWWGAPVPLLPGLAVSVVGLVRRWAWLVVAAVAALCSGRAAAAMLIPPTLSIPVHEWVTLLDDPAPTGALTRATVELNGRHFTASVFGSQGRQLTAHSAGEQLLVSGKTRPLRNGEQWLRWRHVVGGLDGVTIEDWRVGTPLTRSTNRVRSLLSTGAEVMPATERALFLGLAVGDDRAEPPALVTDFRDSGLSHLTAVSGENVAFVLAVCAPFLKRLGLRSRFVITLLIVGWFAALTRFEPSVLRAAAMTALAATSAYTARPASGIRLLALATTALLLIDPLLVHSIGFGLSVGASAGIVLLSGPLQRWMPGPGWITSPLSVTVAAQIGVAPLSIAAFGAMPLVTPLANLLAGPAAGAVMMWGVSAGIVAGLLPPAGATLLHLPTVVLVRWIELVASTGARLPTPVSIALSTAVVGALGWYGRPSAKPDPDLSSRPEPQPRHSGGP
ncbi:MAG: comEC [Acidimicrobiia bacterium]|nr:comEC [Acidimicrobiia bacterium]